MTHKWATTTVYKEGDYYGAMIDAEGLSEAINTLLSYRDVIIAYGSVSPVINTQEYFLSGVIT